MTGKKVVNTFAGLDTDTSLNKYSPDRYTKCVNFRTLLNETNGSHALVNIKGNKKILEFTNPIQGVGEFTDSIVIFVASGRDLTNVYNIPREDFDNINEVDNYKILTQKNFGFSRNSKLRIICREESSDLHKVYFTDTVQPLRAINVKNSNLNEVDKNKFLIVPDVAPSSANLTIIPGSLKAGTVSYAYQLYNVYGSESNFVPLGKTIKLFKSNLTSPLTIKGSSIGESTDKGVKVSIANLDSSFDRIRLVRILYEEFLLEPSIEVVDESRFDNLYEFDDIGIPGLDTYSVEEFNQLLISPSVNTLETKNNYLFLGNTREDIFDVDYDAQNKNNIEYEIITTSVLLNNVEDAPIGVTSLYGIYTYPSDGTFTSNNFVDKTRLGFQRDELYRFGIVLYDTKMRSSFVKYIGDIRIDDDSITNQEGTHSNVKKILFKVNNLPSSVAAYQIVRVPRTRERRSVIDMGGVIPISGVEDNQDTNKEFRSYTNVPHNDRLIEYFSPEISYNKIEEAGTYLQKLYTYAPRNTSILPREGQATLGLGDKRTFTLRTFKYEMDTIKAIRAIEDFKLLTYNPDYTASSPFKEYNINNEYKHFGGLGRDGWFSIESSQVFRGTKGTCGILNLKDPISVTWAHQPHYIAICRRRKNFNNGEILSFYGNLDSNRFIPTSELKLSTEKECVAYGDVYIDMFEYGRAFYRTDEDNDRGGQMVVIPVETTIDLTLTTNPLFRTSIPLKSDINLTNISLIDNIQEVAGVYGFEEKNKFTQDYNLYTYNSAYSRENDIKNFFSKPSDIVFGTNNPTRIYYSDKKVNGEFADSWTKIRPNNFLDLDSRYGPIVRLYAFKDTLFAFQEKAVSAIPVEQRELIQTNTPGPLVAGIGDAVSEPHYLSTESGASDYNSIVGSRHALYYFDLYNKKICRVEDSVKFISDEFNISSLMSYVSTDKVSTGYNKNYNEVLFSFGENGTLVFNEYKNLFTGVYTFNFENSFQHNKYLYLLQDSSVLKSDSADYGKFEDIPSDSFITVIVNPAGNQLAIYDILELTLEVFDKEGSLLPFESVYSVRVYNEYQDTGEILITDDSSTVQRMRTWRINTLVDNTPDEPRIKSSSIFIDIKFRNSDNKKIVLHDIITNVRPIKIH